MSSKKNAISNLLGGKQPSSNKSLDIGLNKPINTEIKESINTDLKKDTNTEKKKVSFDFDVEFHTELKMFAVKHNRNMVDVVVEAVRRYMDER